MFLSFYSSSHKLHINQTKLIEGTVGQFLTIANLPRAQLIHPVQEGEKIVGN
jgi:hypothetical protein